MKKDGSIIQFPIELSKINHDNKIKLLEIVTTIIKLTNKEAVNNIINIDYEITNLYKKYLKLICEEEFSQDLVKQENTMSNANSYNDDYIICLEDNKKLKMLKRHLRTHYNMSISEYKRKWNLPNDYPTVALNYSKKRKEIASKKD